MVLPCRVRASKWMPEKGEDAGTSEPWKHLVKRDLSRNGSIAPNRVLGALV